MNKLNYSKFWGTFNGKITVDGVEYWGYYSLSSEACYLATDGQILASRDEDGEGCGDDWRGVREFLRFGGYRSI